jgi:hypothetical protein
MCRFTLYALSPRDNTSRESSGQAGHEFFNAGRGERDLGFGGPGGGAFYEALVFDLLADLLPGVVRNLGEDGRKAGIELFAGAANDLFTSGLDSGRDAVATIGGHGVERIGESEDAGAEGDVVSGELVWISGAVKAFVVMNDLGSGLEKRFARLGSTVNPDDSLRLATPKKSGMSLAAAASGRSTSGKARDLSSLWRSGLSANLRSTNFQ